MNKYIINPTDIIYFKISHHIDNCILISRPVLQNFTRMQCFKHSLQDLHTLFVAMLNQIIVERM